MDPQEQRDPPIRSFSPVADHAFSSRVTDRLRLRRTNASRGGILPVRCPSRRRSLLPAAPCRKCWTTSSPARNHTTIHVRRECPTRTSNIVVQRIGIDWHNSKPQSDRNDAKTNDCRVSCSALRRPREFWDWFIDELACRLGEDAPGQRRLFDCTCLACTRRVAGSVYPRA